MSLAVAPADQQQPATERTQLSSDSDQSAVQQQQSIRLQSPSKRKDELPLGGRLCRSENVLLTATFAGVVIGFIVGVLLNVYGSDISGVPGLAIRPRALMWLKLPGELFLRALKLIIFPLIVSSLVCAVINLNPRTAGKIGLFAFTYYVVTTLCAVFLGIVLVSIIRPGISSDSHRPPLGTQSKPCGNAPGATSDTMYDLLRNMVPDNLVAVALRSQTSCPEYYVSQQADNDDGYTQQPLDAHTLQNNTNITLNEHVYVKLRTIDKQSMNILGIVVISLVAGIFIGRSGAAGQPLANFFRSAEAVVMAITSAIIWTSPVGIGSLICAQVADMGNIVEDIQKIGLYAVTVIAGLVIHALIVLPLLYLVVVRRNPLRYMVGLLPAYVCAFGTASSSATMPITIRCCRETHRLRNELVMFVIPLGATVNMDGTALYEAVAALFITQYVNNEMPGFAKVLVTSLTATLASIGAAGIPQAGLVTMFMVLIAIDVDPKYISLVLSIDWLLLFMDGRDRIRTTVNVHGDALGAAVIEKLCTIFHVFDEEPAAQSTMTDASTHLEVEPSDEPAKEQVTNFADDNNSNTKGII